MILMGAGQEQRMSHTTPKRPDSKKSKEQWAIKSEGQLYGQLETTNAEHKLEKLRYPKCPELSIYKPVAQNTFYLV